MGLFLDEESSFTSALGAIVILASWSMFFVAQKSKDESDAENQLRKREKIARDDERRKEIIQRSFDFCYDKMNADLDRIKSSFRQTVSVNSLGVKNYTRFKRDVIEYLLDRFPTARINELKSVDLSAIDVVESVATKIIPQIEKMLSDSTEDIVADTTHNVGLEYEKKCQNILNKSGWFVQLTPKSGDHGVDLIAKRRGVKLAVQCKFSKKPIGNSAVQEVVAGRTHFFADFAVVVAPSGFTSGARTLAASNHVHLIHHDDLRDFNPATWRI